MNALSEDPAERAEHYIRSFEGTLQKNQVIFSDSPVQTVNIRLVSDALQRYLKDAKYYLENQKPTTSLASIAYAEGLLDAVVYLALTKPVE